VATHPEATAEKTRLQSNGRSLEALVIYTGGDWQLKIKDSRSEPENALLAAEGVTPGTWVTKTVAQSQGIFA
jgi:hypothetical protein